MPGAYQGGRKSIPSRPGKGGDLSQAAADLQLQDQMSGGMSAAELLRRKKMLGQNPLGQPGVMSAASQALLGR